MKTTEVLEFADRLVFSQTGKHLDNLQKNVIMGVCQGKTYDTIAHDCNRSERHLREVGYKLWKILSRELNEDIHKSNFCATFERLTLSLSSLSSITEEINYHDNFLPKTLNGHPFTSPSQKIDHGLTLAPNILKFCDRETELKTLEHYIFHQNISLTCVLGLFGVGKTTLVRKFVDLNLEKFAVVIWRSLQFPKNLELLIDDFLNVHLNHCQSLPKSLDDKLKQFFTMINNYKYLIILDDVQNIFSSGQLAGQYQNEYQDYQKFFKMIAQNEHQSNLILISQEKNQEMECLEQELSPIKCLELSGLDNFNILKNTGLKDEDSWLKLLTLYEGNFFYLKSISHLIKKNYDGCVSEFLRENFAEDIFPIITATMQSYFEETFNHLSAIEQKILLQLSQTKIPITRENLRKNLNLNSMDFNNGLESLQQRYLVTTIPRNQLLFKLVPVFKEYVKHFC